MPAPEERVIEQPPARAPGGPPDLSTAPFTDDSPRFRKQDSPAESRATRENLQERLERLPPGHPSSPFRDDGSRKPPPPDYRQHELPLPDDLDLADHRPPVERLTSEQYSERKREAEDRIRQAHIDGLASDEQHTVDADNQVWSKERRSVHNAIINDLYSRAQNVPNERRAIIAGGLPGAGKSTVLDSHAGIDRSRYITIDPDKIKEELAIRGLVPQLEGLTPMECSDLVHEESSYIAKRLARRAEADGKNIIWDVTMSSRESAEGRIDKLRSAGYIHVEGIFVDIPLETSQSRAEARYKDGLEQFRAGNGLGGRLVPADLFREGGDEVWRSVNRKTFEEIKHRLDAWSIYDNSIEGRAPVLVDSSEMEEARHAR